MERFNPFGENPLGANSERLKVWSTSLVCVMALSRPHVARFSRKSAIWFLP
jgi:hypothetical protein